MVKKASKSNESDKEIDDGGDSPLIDLAHKDIKKLLQKAKDRGYVTYDEINEAITSETDENGTSSEKNRSNTNTETRETDNNETENTNEEN